MNKESGFRPIKWVIGILGVVLFIILLAIFGVNNIRQVILLKNADMQTTPWIIAGCRMPGNFSILSSHFSDYQESRGAFQSGDLDGTIQRWKKNPEIAIHLLQCANMAYQEVRNEDATLLASFSIAIEDTNPHVHLIKGMALRGLTDWQESSIECQKELENETSPYHAEAAVCIGDNFWELRQPQDALSYYLQAIDLNPQLDSAYAGAGKAIFADSQDVEKALAYLDRAKTINPSSFWYYVLAGNILSESGQDTQACEQFSQAVEINPQNWETRFALATCYKKIGLWQPAIDQLKKALVIEPENLELSLTLGSAYISDGDNEKARSVLEQALALHPNDSRIQQELDRIP